MKLNALGVSRIGLESRIESFTRQLKTMLNNNVERPKAELTLVFKGRNIKEHKLDCFGDTRMVEEKIYKLSTTEEFKTVTAVVEEREPTQYIAYVSI